MRALTDVADLLDTHAKKYERFKDMAARLRELGSLDNFAAETQARLDSLKLAVGEAQGQLDAAQRDIATAKATAEGILKHGRETAAQTIGDAKASAAKTTQDARDQADRMLAQAREQKATIEAEAAIVNTDLTAARKELTDVQKRLGAARETVRRMLAGEAHA